MKVHYSFLVLGLLLLSDLAGCKPASKPEVKPAAEAIPKPISEPLPEPVSGKASFVGVYKALFPATASYTKEIILTLNEDHTVLMSSDSNYLDNIPPAVQKGSWAPLDANSIRVTLVVDAGNGKYINQYIAFTRNKDELIATRYDRRNYGAEGLRPGAGMVYGENRN